MASSLGTSPDSLLAKPLNCDLALWTRFSMLNKQRGRCPLLGLLSWRNLELNSELVVQPIY